MVVHPIQDDEGHAVISDCSECHGHHEVIVKAASPSMAEKGMPHWFECPHPGFGGPIFLEEGAVTPYEPSAAVHVQEEEDGHK